MRRTSRWRHCWYTTYPTCAVPLPGFVRWHGIRQAAKQERAFAARIIAHRRLAQLRHRQIACRPCRMKGALRQRHINLLPALLGGEGDTFALTTGGRTDHHRIARLHVKRSRAETHAEIGQRAIGVDLSLGGDAAPGDADGNGGTGDGRTVEVNIAADTADRLGIIERSTATDARARQWRRDNPGGEYSRDGSRRRDRRIEHGEQAPEDEEDEREVANHGGSLRSDGDDIPLYWNILQISVETVASSRSTSLRTTPRRIPCYNGPMSYVLTHCHKRVIRPVR